MLVIVAMCVSLMKSLRAEPYESTLPSRVRRAVLHAQRYDLADHQTVALASLGADPAPVPDDEPPAAGPTSGPDHGASRLTRRTPSSPASP